MVSLANNHLNDFGSKGANFTVQVLKEAGLKYFGVSYGKFSSSQVSRLHSHKRFLNPLYVFFFLSFSVSFFKIYLLCIYVLKLQYFNYKTYDVTIIMLSAFLPKSFSLFFFPQNSDFQIQNILTLRSTSRKTN